MLFINRLGHVHSVAFDRLVGLAALRVIGPLDAVGGDLLGVMRGRLS